MRYIIIEDEMVACRQLQKIVAQLRPEMQLLCMLDTVEESVEYLKEEQPDLIFMDVELGDGTCFDIINSVDIHSPVIFTTAYNRYAIDAFSVNTVDYLLKPVDAGSVERALEKLENMRTAFSGGMVAGGPAAASVPADRILIVRHSVISYLNISEIAYFKFEDRYIIAYTIDGRSEITEMRKISEVMNCVEGHDFFQLSRGIIASIKAIRKVRKIDNHRIEVEIGTGDNVAETAVISFQRRKSFLTWLGR